MADLEQRLQLCLLDKELAEETSRALQTELQECKARIAELQELVDVSSDFAEALAEERKLSDLELETAKVRISELENEKYVETQAIAAQFEADRLKRELKAKDLDIAVLKHGASGLCEVWSANNSNDKQALEFAKFVDTFQIPLDPEFELFKSGEITNTDFRFGIEQRLINSIPRLTQPQIESAFPKLALDPPNPPSGYMKLLQERMHALGMQPPAASEPPSKDAGVNLLLARLAVLEAKIDSAEQAVSEADTLRSTANEATERANNLVREIHALNLQHEQLVLNFDEERRAMLPNALAYTELYERVQKLQRALQFSTPTHIQPLTPLTSQFKPVDRPFDRVRKLQSVFINEIHLIDSKNENARVDAVSVYLSSQLCL